MRKIAFLLSSVSLSTFAATPELSGTYMSECTWDIFPATADRSFVSFSGNKMERRVEYYSDYLCMHKLENPSFGNHPITKAIFSIGQAVPGVTYGINGDSSYKITFLSVERLYADNTVELVEFSVDGCVYLTTGFETNEVLYLGKHWDENIPTPCNPMERVYVKIKQ